MKTQTRNIVIAIGATVLVLGGWYAFEAYRGSAGLAGPSMEEVTPSATVEAPENVPPAMPGVATVKVAYLDASGNGTGPSRGCDKLVLVDTPVATTTAPLTAALQALFANNSAGTTNQYNFIAKTKATLSFNNATVSNGVAKVYLTGNLSNLSGVCDDPRAKIQIEETALQFPTVQSVQIYLNNQLTNLTPSQQ